MNKQEFVESYRHAMRTISVVPLAGTNQIPEYDNDIWKTSGVKTISQVDIASLGLGLAAQCFRSVPLQQASWWLRASSMTKQFPATRLFETNKTNITTTLPSQRDSRGGWELQPHVLA